MSTNHEKQFDKKAIFIGALLFVCILILSFTARNLGIKVSSFNLEDKEVSVLERQIILSFNAEVDKNLMEENFKIEPFVDGKFSWVGRKLYYTFSEPLNYGSTYKVSIADIFEANFYSYQKEFFYISHEDYSRRISGLGFDDMSLNYYTPDYLLVTDFKFLSKGEKILFLAVEKSNINSEDQTAWFPDLYILDIESMKIEQITKDENYLNLDLFVSESSDFYALNRMEVDKETGAPVSLQNIWIAELGKKLKPFWYSNLNPEDIIFTPDSKWILALSREGYMLLPIDFADGAPQFLGNFNKSFGFSNDYSVLAFSQWKDENIFAETNEVILMKNNGAIETLLADTGVIEEFIFDYDANNFYILMFEPGTSKAGIYIYDYTNSNLQEVLPQKSESLYSQISISYDEEEISYQITGDSNKIEILKLSTGKLIYSVNGLNGAWR